MRVLRGKSVRAFVGGSSVEIEGELCGYFIQREGLGFRVVNQGTGLGASLRAGVGVAIAFIVDFDG